MFTTIYKETCSNYNMLRIKYKNGWIWKYYPDQLAYYEQNAFEILVRGLIKWKK